MKEHLTASHPSGRHPEHNSRPGVACDDGQIGLGAMPTDHQLPHRTTRCGPLCFQSDPPTTQLHQLKAGPRGDGRWMHLRRVANPSDRENNDTDQLVESTPSPCVTSLVPHTTRDGNKTASPSPSHLNLIYSQQPRQGLAQG